MEMHDALSGWLTDVGEDVDAFSAEDGHLRLADALSDIHDLMHDVGWARKEIVAVGLRDD